MQTRSASDNMTELPVIKSQIDNYKLTKLSATKTGSSLAHELRAPTHDSFATEP